MLRVSRRKLVAILVASSAVQALPAAAQSEPLLGQIMCAGYNFTPRGWAELNGQILPIASNTALFSLLGTQYGGNGMTTFALPDLRGRTVIGAGNGPGLTPRSVGETGGSEVTTLTVANLPTHAHSFAPLGSNNDATSISPAGKVAATKARTTLYADPVNIVSGAVGSTSATGGGVPAERMQPFLTIKCYIALEGIYPSRE